MRNLTILVIELCNQNHILYKLNTTVISGDIHEFDTFLGRKVHQEEIDHAPHA